MLFLQDGNGKPPTSIFSDIEEFTRGEISITATLFIMSCYIINMDEIMMMMVCKFFQLMYIVLKCTVKSYISKVSCDVISCDHKRIIILSWRFVLFPLFQQFLRQRVWVMKWQLDSYYYVSLTNMPSNLRKKSFVLF